MIVKVKSHKRPSFKALLNYMVHNKDRLFNSGGKSLLITHNIKGNSLEEWVEQFKYNESFRLKRRIDSVYCTHEILSWHRSDSSKVTTKKLEDIARAYIKLRNPRGIYIIVPHFDKEHYHLHICASGIEYRTGKSLRLSKQAFAKLKVDIQEYQIQKYPELSESRVRHGKVVEMGKEWEKGNPKERDKEKVRAILKTCYKKANSMESFSQLLIDWGAAIYKRSGKMTGIVYQSRKYRFSRLGVEISQLKQLVSNTIRTNELKKVRRKCRTTSIER